ncbi:unnamed protein product [Blepharisma stoltei]|uniref:DNA/RNA-binding protein Alba-like domain-containing protein n=1 Tax=Blepharisma stoltei TaxID=1481888 RepID=A0AAU9JID1_9CILI|nr:unnamed protein product [Blepharisma stoltei]
MENSTVIKVSLRRPYPAFVAHSKEILKEHGHVELQGLGEASANTVRAAEMLCSLGYADLEKFETLSVTEPDHKNIDRRRNKVVVALTRSAGFDKAYNEFANSRETPK